MKYLPRIVDVELDLRLRSVGATVLVGPKWCGKTTTAKQKAKSVLEMQDPDLQEGFLKLAATKPDAIVCLGAVVQGATAHADLINQATAKAFTEISVSSGVPVIDGVVSAESLEQAVERCGTKQGNKGFSAMQAAIETANVAKKL